MITITAILKLFLKYLRRVSKHELPLDLRNIKTQTQLGMTNNLSVLKNGFSCKLFWSLT